MKKLKLVRVSTPAGDFHALVSSQINFAYFKGFGGAPSISDVNYYEELALAPPESETFCSQLTDISEYLKMAEMVIVS